MVNIWVRIESNSDLGSRCLHPAFGLMVSEVGILYTYIIFDLFNHTSKICFYKGIAMIQ